MSDKKNIVICATILLMLAVLTVVIKNSKTDNTKNMASTTIEISNDSNEEYVISFLATVESEYRNGLTINANYTRRDFYNVDSMNIDSEEGYIEFVVLKDINAYKVYNENGEEIEELPELKFEDNTVEISSKNEFVEGNFYLIRYAPYSENYTYYYVTELANSGFEKLDFYIITFGEAIDSINY